MDIFAQNNTSVTADYVKFISSTETISFYNIAGNGASDSGVLHWDMNVGFTLTIKLGSSPGTGCIKVFKDRTLIQCWNFNNPSVPMSVDLNEGCAGAYYVYIEPTNC